MIYISKLFSHSFFSLQKKNFEIYIMLFIYCTNILYIYIVEYWLTLQMTVSLWWRTILVWNMSVLFCMSIPGPPSKILRGYTMPWALGFLFRGILVINSILSLLFRVSFHFLEFFCFSYSHWILYLYSQWFLS